MNLQRFLLASALSCLLASACAESAVSSSRESHQPRTFSLGVPPIATIEGGTDRITLRALDHSSLGILGPAGSIHTEETTHWVPSLSAGATSMLLPTFAQVGETSMPLAWESSGFGADALNRFVQFDYASSAPPLKLRSSWSTSSGRGHPVLSGGILEHSFTVENCGTSTVSLPLLPSLVFVWQPQNPEKTDLLWVEKTAGGPTDTGVHIVPLDSTFSLHLASTPYSEDDPLLRDAIPFMSVCDRASRRGWFAGIEFSGRVALHTEALAGSPRTFVTTLGLDPRGCDGHETPIVLAPGETLVTPEIFVGCYSGDFDNGCNVLRDWVSTHLRPRPLEPNYPLLTNNSWGSGMAVDERLARSMIDESAGLCLEMFHVDAGWFRGVGNWHEMPQKFPSGLAAIADYAHERGLLFGLWTGWTQGGAEQFGQPQRAVLSVFDPAMRPWFTRDYPPEWKPAEFSGADVCLADKRAESWCLDELRRIVRSSKLDLLEHDQRMIVSMCERSDHGHSSAPTEVARRACEAYYRIQDALRSENHRLLFEDCVNGGRMVDYGVVRRVHYISICDSYDPLSNRRAFHDNVYCLPAAMCECYVANVEVKNLPEFRSMLRSGMMGWCSIMCDTKAWSNEQHAAAAREFGLYKTRLRTLIREADVYHISERPDGIRWDGMQFQGSTSGRGVVYAFRGETSDTVHRYKLRGLDPAATYSLEFADQPSANRQESGRLLMEEGLEVGLALPKSSELVFLTALDR